MMSCAREEDPGKEAAQLIVGRGRYIVCAHSLVGKFDSKIRAVKSYQVLDAGVVVKETKP